MKVEYYPFNYFININSTLVFICIQININELTYLLLWNNDFQNKLQKLQLLMKGIIKSLSRIINKDIWKEVEDNDVKLINNNKDNND